MRLATGRTGDGEKTDELMEHGRDNYHSKILMGTSNFNWLSANR